MHAGARTGRHAHEKFPKDDRYTKQKRKMRETDLPHMQKQSSGAGLVLGKGPGAQAEESVLITRHPWPAPQQLQHY